MEQQRQPESRISQTSGIPCDVCSKLRNHWRILLLCSIMVTLVSYVLCGLFLKTALKERMEFFIGVGVVLVLIPVVSFTIYGIVKFLKKREPVVIPWSVQQQHMQYSGEISSSDSTEGEPNRENEIINNNRNAHHYYNSIPSPEISKYSSQGSRKESESHSRRFETETSQGGNFRYPLRNTHAQYSPERYRQRNALTRSNSNATRFRYDFDSERNGRTSETPKGGIENGRYVLDIKRHPEANCQKNPKAVKRHQRSKSETTDNRPKSVVRKRDIANEYVPKEYSEIDQENCGNRQPLQRQSRSRSEPKECISRRKTEDDFSPDALTSYMPRNFTRKVQQISQSWHSVKQPVKNRKNTNSLSNTEIIQYLSPDLENTNHVTENEQMPPASSRNQGNEYIPTSEMEHPCDNTRISEYMQRNNRRTLGELGNQNYISRNELTTSYPSTSRETLRCESAYSSDTMICSSGYGTEENKHEGISMRQCPPARSADGFHLRIRSNKYINGRQFMECSSRNGDYRTGSELQGREYHQQMAKKAHLIAGIPSTNMGHAIVQPMLENIKALNYPFQGCLPEQYTFARKENGGRTEHFHTWRKEFHITLQKHRLLQLIL